MMVACTDGWLGAGLLPLDGRDAPRCEAAKCDD